MKKITWNHVRWLYGIMFFPLFWFLIPPITDWLMKKYNIHNKEELFLFIKNFFAKNKRNIAIFLFILSLILIFIPKPELTLGYINTDGAILCHEPNAKTGFESLPLLEPVKVYKDHYKKNGFYQTELGNYIKESVIIFEGTKDFENAKSQKIKQDKEIAEAKAKMEEIQKKYLAKRISTLEKTISQIAYKIDIQEYGYDYYVSPLTWLNSTYDDKIAFFNICAEYGKYKTNQSQENEIALGRVKIKNSLNGQTIGEYSIWNGYKFQ